MEFVLMLWEYIDPLTITFSWYLALSLVLGFLIGLERESRHKDAGISTHMLVISGAMLFTFFSTGITTDSEARIAAQIVTGIGFLGAGLILKDGVTVRNLTTAASLWFAAAIGMAIGFGFYQIALLASVAALIIPRVPHFQKQVTELEDPVAILLEKGPTKKKTAKKRVVKKRVSKKV